MNDDLDWTYDLGTAVLNQRADVLNAIQSFRDQAYAAGNLRSDERQTVARDDGAIAIKPADPQVIYVPYYEPERVVVYQTTPVYHYYPYRYPVYYYPYPAHYAFGTGFWGVRSWFSIGWHSHHVHVYDWHYANHPYYGWNYYDPFYSHNVYVNVNVNNHDHVWQPHYRYGGRPVVRGHEGRVYTATTPPAHVSRGVGGLALRSRTSKARRSAVATEPNRVSRGVAGSACTAIAARRNHGAGARQRRTFTVAARRNRIPTPRARRARYRGRGMSQALERGRAQQNRAAPPARALQESTGMPREMSRGTEMRTSPPRAAAPMSRESSGGGMSSAQRGSSRRRQLPWRPARRVERPAASQRRSQPVRAAAAKAARPRARS